MCAGHLSWKVRGLRREVSPLLGLIVLLGATSWDAWGRVFSVTSKC